MADDCKCKGVIGNLPPGAGEGVFAPDPHVVDGTVHTTTETNTSKVLAPNGTGGVQWIDGGGASIGESWIFKTAIGDTDPGSRNFKFDDIIQSDSTFIYVSNISSTNVDFSTVLLELKQNDNIYIQDNTDSSSFHLCKVTADVIDATTYVKIPITVEDSGLDLLNNRNCGWLLLFSGGAEEASYTPGHLYKLNIKYTATNQITIDAGNCRDIDNTNNIVLSTPQVVNIDNSGANGLDTGTKAANSWYSVWIIKDPSVPSVAGLLSLSSTTPTLPSGYTVKRRIGWIKTDSSSNVVLFVQSGSSQTKEYIWNNSYIDTTVLANGTSTLFTDIDLSTWIPVTSESAHIHITHEEFYTDLSASGHKFRPNGSTQVDPQITLLTNFNIYEHLIPQLIWMPTDSNQVIEYYTLRSEDLITVWVYGWKEDL